MQEVPGLHSQPIFFCFKIFLFPVSKQSREANLVII